MVQDKWKVPAWTRTQYVGQIGLEFTAIYSSSVGIHSMYHQTQL